MQSDYAKADARRECSGLPHTLSSAATVQVAADPCDGCRINVCDLESKYDQIKVWCKGKQRPDDDDGWLLVSPS